MSKEDKNWLIDFSILYNKKSQNPFIFYPKRLLLFNDTRFYKLITMIFLGFFLNLIDYLILA